MNATKLFIQERMNQLGITSVELVRRLGYKEISGGLRKVERYAEGFFKHPFIAPKMHLVLEVPQEELRSVIKQDTEAFRKVEEDEKKARKIWERDHFWPFLFVRTERERPQNYTMAAFTGMGSFKYGYLPKDFNHIPKLNSVFLFWKSLKKKCKDGMVWYHSLIRL